MKEIVLPQMGQSVEEAEIVQWMKKEGDTVEVGEPIFTIQTDKAEVECESTESGVLRKILVPEAVEVPVLTPVALVGTADEAMPDLSKYEAGGAVEAPAEAPAPVAAEEAPAPAAAPTPVAEVAPAGLAEEASFASPRARKTGKSLDIDATALKGSGPAGRVLEEDVLTFQETQEAVASTPSARRMAKMEGLDLTAVPATGPGGRVVKEDVASVLQGGAPVPAAAPAASPAAKPAPAAAKSGAGTPLTPMRRIIAQRLAESKFSAPHFYVTVEVDMKGSVDYRQAMAATGFKPSFNDMVMRATTRALQEFPAVNARWHGDSIEELSEVNLGFACALPTGLIVPVVKGIEKKSLQDISRETRELVEKARGGKLTPDDYTGNTFTVSNLGAFGVDHFTAIINPPDAAILAIGQIKERPVVVNGGIQVRPIMKLTLSSDHRVIDGAVAAQFMGRLKDVLEKADF